MYIDTQFVCRHLKDTVHKVRRVRIVKMNVLDTLQLVVSTRVKHRRVPAPKIKTSMIMLVMILMTIQLTLRMTCKEY